MRRTLIRDLAEERAINALSYIAHYQEGDDMETLRDVAKTALDEWAKARITPESLPRDEASKGAAGEAPNPTPGEDPSLNSTLERTP